MQCRPSYHNKPSKTPDHTRDNDATHTEHIRLNVVLVPEIISAEISVNSFVLVLTGKVKGPSDILCTQMT